jgi:hypothetical protein
MSAEASIRYVNKIKYQEFYFQIYYAFGSLSLPEMPYRKFQSIGAGQK